MRLHTSLKIADIQHGRTQAFKGTAKRLFESSFHNRSLLAEFSTIQSCLLSPSHNAHKRYFFSGFARNRYPTPRTVRRWRGCTGSSSI